MGMAFRLEPWWPLGDDRWTVFALICLIVVILTYFIPDELEWVNRIKDSSDWKMFRFKVAVFLHAKGSAEKAKAELDLGWKEGDWDDPDIEERHEAELRRGLGLEPRKQDDD